MHRFSLAASAALLVAGTMACSDTTSPTTGASSFESAASADLAPTAGDEIGNDYDFYSSASASSLGSSFSIMAPVGANVRASIAPPSSIAAAWINPACTYTPATLNFVCPTISWHGYTLNASYQLFDAASVPQSAYSATTTASINFIVSDTGAVAFTWNQNSYADTASHHRNATVSNLAGTPDTLHIWNATGSTNAHSVRSGQITKTYLLASSDTTTNVAIRQPRGLNPYPLSGTIVRNYAVTRTRQASDTTTHSTSRRVVVTFNGTANVPMTVGTEQYMLNLDTHRVTKQH